MIKRIAAVLTMSLVMSACVHQPPETEVTETRQRDGKLPWPEDAVVIDVRKRFEYELGHWPKAYNLPAHEATRVDRDLKRRLALLGVNPRFVLVLVGNEKPLAMANQLKNIGLEKVKAYALHEVKLPLTRETPLPPSPKPVW